MTAVIEPTVVGPVPSPRRWRRRIVRLVLAVIVLAVAYVGVTFVQVYRASQHDGARSVDAIIVLGAAQYDGRPSPVLQDRLDHALELYEAGLAEQIVLTGGRQEGDRFTEATAGYNYLRDKGVPDDALLKEVEGTSTWESLRASARFLLARGVTTVVLVTDDYHAFRVEAIAEDIGLDATVSPTDSRLSSASRLRQLARETAAVAVGRLIGYDRLFRIDHAVNE
ncbi:MAG: YdcF family protein [Acidimicrobiales bacterium]